MDALQQLIDIVHQLRDPVTGCEWDRKQTFASLKNYTLEESYELLDAIDRKDNDELKKELGDLLFHILFYADLAKTADMFTFEDICQAAANKLVTRHPHIFKQAESTAKPNWELLKQQERNQKAQYSLLDDIPTAMPALMRAEKIQKRCAAVGFDWAEVAPVLDKVKEELTEVTAELAEIPNNHARIDEEIGDLLFATVNLARHLKINPELCLQRANQKFERRFREVEERIQAKNISLQQATTDEMELEWQMVKWQEKQSELI
ncbi:nucleoside triphosphate pyrophosphohydrolase [Orbaceae bacterium ESL0721]|nr:nucleoside triphosphate pyrophosphohydrolase [Orbaceae bacterium ESL0721]